MSKAEISDKSSKEKLSSSSMIPSILAISAGTGSTALVANGMRLTGESGTLNWNGEEQGKSGGVCLAASYSRLAYPR